MADGHGLQLPDRERVGEVVVLVPADGWAHGALFVAFDAVRIAQVELDDAAVERLDEDALDPRRVRRDAGA